MAEKTYRVPAVEKCVRLIQVLCESSKPLTLTEIAKGVGTNNNMAYRILRTLEAEGWIIQEKPGPKYRMSLRPFHFTSMPASRMDLTTAALEPMLQFWEKHGECCYLGVLDGDRVLYLETMDAVGGSVRIAVSRGERYILHTAAPGKVLLAHNEDVAEALLSAGLERYTENTICEPDEFHAEMQRIRENGYALDNEEGARGLLCLAVPIFNNESKVIGTFGISSLTVNYADIDEVFDKLGEDVIEVGKQISAALGHVGEGSSLD